MRYTHPLQLATLLCVATLAALPAMGQINRNNPEWEKMKAKARTSMQDKPGEALYVVDILIGQPLGSIKPGESRPLSEKPYTVRYSFAVKWWGERMLTTTRRSSEGGPLGGENSGPLDKMWERPMAFDFAKGTSYIYEWMLPERRPSGAPRPKRPEIAALRRDVDGIAEPPSEGTDSPKKGKKVKKEKPKDEKQRRLDSIRQAKAESAVWVEDSIVLPKWRITEDTMTIDGYPCRAARWESNEGHVIAWFSTRDYGRCAPPMFVGLPGVVVRVNVGELEYRLEGLHMEAANSIFEMPQSFISRQSLEAQRADLRDKLSDKAEQPKKGKEKTSKKSRRK